MGIGVVAGLVVMVGGASARAQCAGFQTGGGLPGAVRSVTDAVLWDPDGPGPRGPLLIVGGVGGSTEFAGNILLGPMPGGAGSSPLAAYNLATRTWSHLPGGVLFHTFQGAPAQAIVKQVIVLPDNRLAVFGQFSRAGGLAVPGFAVYNGLTDQWQAPAFTGGPIDASVGDVARMPDGRYAMLGTFLVGPGFSVTGSIGIFDPATTSLSLFPSNATPLALPETVSSIGVLDNNDFILGWGVLNPVVNGVDIYGSRIFRVSYATQEISTFPDIPAIDTTPPRTVIGGVRTILGLSNGEFIVGGGVARISGVGFVQHRAISHRWKPQTQSWEPLTDDPTIPNTPNHRFRLRPDGLIDADSVRDRSVADGVGAEGSAPRSMIGVYDPQTRGWTPEPTTNEYFNLHSAVVPLPDGQRFIGTGAYARSLRPDGQYVAFETPPGLSADGNVNDLELFPNGDVLVVGGFTSVSGTPAGGVARYNPATGAVTALAASTSPGFKYAAVRPDGTFVLAGNFTEIDGVPMNGVAEYSGEWLPMGAGVDHLKYGVGFLTDGTTVVVGSDGVLRFDGTDWVPLGGNVSGDAGNGLEGQVLDLVTLPGNGLVVTGNFTTAGGVSAPGVARWTGSAWQAMGAGFPNGGAGDVYRAPDGTIYVTADQAVWRWSEPAAAWIRLGGQFQNGAPATIASLPDGRLVVGGVFTGVDNVVAANMAVWNGSSWSALPNGKIEQSFAASWATPPYIYAMVPLGSRELLVGGNFYRAGEPAVFAPNLARYTYPCVADFNCSGAVTVQDIFDFLAAYFTASPRADVNASGSVTVQDIFDFLAAYFRGC